ncbi:programmed cell death protein 5 [Schistocerca americana]|uniref:programmed cell death protein 5 n=1 Tax=Schistocerca americana TaxID=7009 RepID=UPI001F50252B|nr:programmed cell death protein 5 [Schistocerca americana]
MVNISGKICTVTSYCLFCAVGYRIMGDAEFDDMRAKRLGLAHSKYKENEFDNRNAAEEKKREQEEMKNSILSQVLDQSARARLNTLMIGKPEKGRLIEDMIVHMARTGQLMGKLNENGLINIMEKVSERIQRPTTTVKFDRRRAALDDSDDDI